MFALNRKSIVIWKQYRNNFVLKWYYVQFSIVCNSWAITSIYSRRLPYNCNYGFIFLSPKTTCIDRANLVYTFAFVRIISCAIAIMLLYIYAYKLLLFVVVDKKVMDIFSIDFVRIVSLYLAYCM